MQIRAIGVGLALMAVSAGVSALAVEGALRIGWIPNPKHQVVSNAQRWTRADRRVLILGDSFIVPYGGLGKRLDRALDEHGVAVWNLAVSGTGPFEYLERLRAFDREAPDVVLLSYYAGNDLTNVQNHPKHDPDRSSTAIRIDPPPPLNPLPDSKWYHALYATHWLRPMLTPEPGPRPFDWDAFARAGIDPGLIEDAKQQRINPYLMELSVRSPEHLLDNILMERDVNRRAWLRVQDLLDALREECRARGARLLIAVFPRSIQIDRSLFGFFEKLKFQLDARTLETARPQEGMAAYAARSGVPVLDLLPEFRQRRSVPLYRKSDDHLNRAGNAVAAELLAPWLIEHLD